MSILSKCCSFERSTQESSNQLIRKKKIMVPQKYEALLFSTSKFSQHITMFFEESSDTEDWSNDTLLHINIEKSLF